MIRNPFYHRLLLGLLLAAPLLGQAQARRNPWDVANKIQAIKTQDGTHPVCYNLPELIGRYTDDFGAVRLELFANGTATFRFRNGATQHVRWGIRLDRTDDPTARYYTYDAEGHLTYELLFEHLDGDKAFEYEQADYVPSFTGRRGTPYIVIERPPRTVWALQKEK